MLHQPCHAKTAAEYYFSSAMYHFGDEPAIQIMWKDSCEKLPMISSISQSCCSFLVLHRAWQAFVRTTMWPTKPEAKTITETRQPPQPDFHLPQVYIIHALRPLNLPKLRPGSSEKLLLIALPQHNANFKFHSQRSRNQRQVFKRMPTPEERAGQAR